jgi:hypothetical protein
MTWPNKANSGVAKPAWLISTLVGNRFDRADNVD